MKPLQIDTFKEISILSDVKYSPDGTKIVFSTSKADMEKDGYANNLWLYENGKIRQLTYGNREKDFIFADDHTVLFRSDAESDAPNYSTWKALDLETGIITVRYRFPIPAEKPVLLNSGDLLLSGSVFPAFENLYSGNEEELQNFAEYIKDEADFEAVDTYPWWNNGGPFSRGMYHSLFLYHAGKLERLTEPGQDISNIKVSADQKTVYYLKTDAGFRHTMARSLCSFDLAERCETEILPGTYLISDYVPCENRIVIACTERTHGFCSDPDLYIFDPENNRMELLAELDRSMNTLKYSGGKIWLIASDYDSTYLCTAENGTVVKKTSKTGLVSSYDVHGDDFVTAAQFDMKPHGLYDSNGNQLTHFNDILTDEYFRAVPEPVAFENDGVDLRGYVLKPQDFDENRKYPAILYIHGGPKGMYAPVYMIEHQYWASQGYIVLFTNIRGSDGRGGAFADIRGKLGTVDYSDLMKFTDTVIEKYAQIDTQKLFVTGGSYGGYMTNWIITHTGRFTAAISQCCISNWISLNQLSDIGYEFSEDLCASDPWDAEEKMWNQSPLKYAKNAATPTLFIHGSEDYRTPIDQCWQMYTALKRNGTDTKAVLFRGDHHGLSIAGKPSHRIRRLREMTDWFSKYK